MLTKKKTILTLSTPAVPNCCCLKGPAPYWSNPPLLIFDIRLLWCSAECQKLRMVGQTSMAKCKALTGSVVKELKCHLKAKINTSLIDKPLSWRAGDIVQHLWVSVHCYLLQHLKLSICELPTISTALSAVINHRPPNLHYNRNLLTPSPAGIVLAESTFSPAQYR